MNGVKRSEASYVDVKLMWTWDTKVNDIYTNENEKDEPSESEMWHGVNVVFFFLACRNWISTGIRELELELGWLVAIWGSEMHGVWRLSWIAQHMR